MTLRFVRLETAGKALMERIVSETRGTGKRSGRGPRPSERLGTAVRTDRRTSRGRPS